MDANGQALVHVYARETSNEANIAGVLTFDEARRIAVNIAMPELLATNRGDFFGYKSRWTSAGDWRW